MILEKMFCTFSKIKINRIHPVQKIRKRAEQPEDLQFGLFMSKVPLIFKSFLTFLPTLDLILDQWFNLKQFFFSGLTIFLNDLWFYYYLTHIWS